MSQHPRHLLWPLLALTATVGCSGLDPSVDDTTGGTETDQAKKKHDMRHTTHDMSVAGPDLSIGHHDMGGPGGGALRFAFFGDTRPGACSSGPPGSPYPTAVVEAIFRAIDGQAVQFVVVGGDYIYVCSTNAAEAGRQMDLFLAARKQLNPLTPVHYVLGNHEDKNIPTFQAKLSPQVYWSFNQGNAKFVAIANDAWDATQSAWLDSTLSVPTTYTFVFRHQYWGGSGTTHDGQIKPIVDKYPFTLFMAGHDHAYKHHTEAVVRGAQRDVVVGNGGAPFDATWTNPFHGFSVVEEQPDGQIKVVVYSVQPGTTAPPVVMDTWSVSP